MPPWARDDECFYPVYGTVALWGRYVEHAGGYRAKHAIIRRLWVSERVGLATIQTLRGPVVLEDAPFRDLVYLPDPALPDILGRVYEADVKVVREIFHGQRRFRQ